MASASSFIGVATADISSSSDLPDVIPLFPLPRTLLLPRGHLPLNIFEKRYLSMINDALGKGRFIGMIQPRGTNNDNPPEIVAGTPSLYDVGTLGRITSFSETSDGRYLISLFGVTRFRIERELDAMTPYRQAHVRYDDFVNDFEVGAGEDDVDRSRLISLLKAYLQQHELKADWSAIRDSDNETLVNSLCMMSPYGVNEKQALLEAPTLDARNEILIAITELALAQESGSSTLQ